MENNTYFKVCDLLVTIETFLDEIEAEFKIIEERINIPFYDLEMGFKESSGMLGYKSNDSIKSLIKKKKIVPVIEKGKRDKVNLRDFAKLMIEKKSEL